MSLLPRTLYGRRAAQVHLSRVLPFRTHSPSPPLQVIGSNPPTQPTAWTRKHSQTQVPQAGQIKARVGALHALRQAAPWRCNSGAHAACDQRLTTAGEGAWHPAAIGGTNSCMRGRSGSGFSVAGQPSIFDLPTCAPSSHQKGTLDEIGVTWIRNSRPRQALVLHHYREAGSARRVLCMKWCRAGAAVPTFSILVVSCTDACTQEQSMAHETSMHAWHPCPRWSNIGQTPC